MIWWTWRQHRSQALWTAAPMAALGVWMFLAGRTMADQYKHLGVASCLAARGDCSAITNQFLDSHHGYEFLIPLFLIVPAVIGVFWGAPLVARELETGTHRLAWTQSVTPRRWLAIKLALLGAAMAAFAGVFAWLVSWFSGPLAGAGQNRLSPGVFDLRGIVPIGYALFAFALGVAAGVVLRRTVAAMAATLFGYAAVRALVALALRQHLRAAATISYPFNSTAGSGGDWVLHSETIDRFGHVVGHGHSIELTNVAGICPPPALKDAKDSAIDTCVQKLGLRTIAKVQPIGRYWWFQGVEVALFVALAAALVAFTFWWIRRTLS